MAKMYLLCGLPGSGKSSKARKLQEALPGSQLFEADMYFTNPDGTYLYDKTLVSEAHSWCRFATEQAMDDYCCDVIVANTFIRRKDREIYEAMAARHGYEFQIVKCRGEWASVHNVPTDVIARMREAWEE